jgi:hypothetical protein
MEKELGSMNEHWGTMRSTESKIIFPQGTMGQGLKRAVLVSSECWRKRQTIRKPWSAHYAPASLNISSTLSVVTVSLSRGKTFSMLWLCASMFRSVIASTTVTTLYPRS